MLCQFDSASRISSAFKNSSICRAEVTRPKFPWIFQRKLESPHVGSYFLNRVLAFPFEELHRTLVALGGCPRGERSQVSSLPGARITFAGIQAILAGL